MQPERSTTPGAGGALDCLALLARLHGVAADPARLAHDLALSGPPTPEDLLRAARRLRLRARLSSFDPSAAAAGRTPLPCLVELREGEVARFVLLARLDAERALLHDPALDCPVTLPRAAFDAVLTGRALHASTRASLASELARFDFTWFIPALVKYRWLVGEALVASIALQLFALATPLFFQAVMDKVLVHRGLSTLTVIGIGLAATVLFESVLSALRTWVFAHTTSRVDVELGARLFRHLLALPLAYFEARRVGDSVARVRELEHIRAFLTGPALMSVLDVAFTGLFIAVMLFYSVTLTLVVLASIPLYALLAWSVMPRLRRRLEERFSRGADNQAFLVESVTNIQTLKAGALEPVSQRRWEEQLAGYVAASFRVTRLSAFAGEAVQLVQKLVTVAILWLGALQVMEGAMTIGALVAFNMLAARVAQPILRLAQLWQDFQQTGVSMARLADILDTRPEGSAAAAASRAQLPPIRGEVRLDAVHFRYRPKCDEVLRGLSLALQAGQMLGIVGRSGSGKSTVAKLIQRLYVPERGRVLIDGVDLALADPAWLRRQVGVVLQENRLFARSVRENIALADPGAPMEAVMQAARLAGAHDFILELPEGYDTLVGEQGATLSGGQRQRIAIARALLTDPRILILDEATSSLDYESERIVQENMRAIAAGRTVIVIAHRLTAVREANRIVVLDHGEIVEEGSHAELIQKPLGRYARLYQMQAG
jgi:subfamily B ATP-binding cassette protein HlyB/CyaB